MVCGRDPCGNVAWMELKRPRGIGLGSGASILLFKYHSITHSSWRSDAKFFITWLWWQVMMPGYVCCRVAPSRLGLLEKLISFSPVQNFVLDKEAFSNKVIDNAKRWCNILYSYALWYITRFIWFEKLISTFFKVLKRIPYRLVDKSLYRVNFYCDKNIFLFYCVGLLHRYDL